MELLKKGTTAKTVYDVELIKTINLFEQVTHARVKEAFYMKDTLVFLVFEGDKFKALGKELSNLKKIEKMLQKKIRIVEFNSDPVKFITNLIYPYRVETITLNDGIVTISDQDPKTKGLLIGAKAQNLRMYESIAKKYFEITEIKVV
ncbi:MAG TPA: NusA-like transcription termination signal-binding factor [Allocoleopsis sp.]